MEEEIYQLARQLGEVSEGEEEALRTLCAGAEEELRLRLRSGCTPESCGKCFPLAAAWLALAGLEGLRGGVTDFSAGDMRISAQGGEGSAWYYAQAQRTLSPYLEDDGFCFRGVRG